MGSLNGQCEPSPNGDNCIIRDEIYYRDHVVFQVENTLFKMPRSRFQHESVYFRERFVRNSGNANEPIEGSSDEHPLVLNDVTAKEFRSLLEVMFALCVHIDYLPPLNSEDDWTRSNRSLLKLSTRWEMAAFRKHAIGALSEAVCPEDPSDGVRWLVFAREYVVHEWLLRSLVTLATRSQPLEMHEVEPLGLETFVALTKIREGARVNRDVKQAVLEAFGKELKEAEAKEKRWRRLLECRE
ncbi:uncharacterized protein BXZ73DRAFT_41783 [Epithele typhae]|uniref:uncharacterized protein n=1 Tax=Epithele typhae TaxID=378194 RepID=UPI002007ECE8|nr:uncharacterized protein BXZ73DRAFT_41783 [Epithele typhae]KAH9941622.1 hypothetical protein BXZ73DRAFT_41783 [Epithele typhae]